MKTYAFDFINNAPIRSFESRKHAQSHGNAFTLVSTEEELNKAQVGTGAFAEVYNRHVDADKKVSRFSDRATAAKRLFALAQAKAIEVAAPTEKDDSEMAKDEAKAPKAPKVPKEKKETRGVHGRAPLYEGKTIKLGSKWPAEGLPGREGTKRQGAYKIVADLLKKSPDGVKFEDYMAAGGNVFDLKDGVTFRSFFTVA